MDDGRRSSESFELENEFENAVVQYIKETTQKGKDGTTTAVLIMATIIKEAFKDLDNELGDKDYHGMALSLRKGLDEALKKIKSTPVKTKEELYTVAYNSYKNKEIAELIAETVYKIGKDGVIAIEDSQTTKTEVEVVHGLELLKGYVSPYFINTDKEEVILKDAIVLLVNKKLESLVEVLPLLTSQQGGKLAFDCANILIIADGFGNDIINRLAFFKATNQVNPLLIEIPTGDKLEILKDIAVILGATSIDGKLLTLETADKTCLGQIASVVSIKDKTKLIGGKGKKSDIKEYVDRLKALTITNKYELDSHTRRIAQIIGGIAVIKVGAYTDNELKAMKTKIENAKDSAQAAFKSGVVSGAGKTLSDITTSSNLLNKALKAPRRQLEENGVQYLDEKTTDPTEVVTTALTTAVSIAEGLLTIGAISTNKRKEEKE